jgi:ABC-type glycerol-3-phosphate transport system permease component
VLRLWWAYLWRGILATIGAMILGALVGAILGFGMGAAGFPLEAIKFVGTIVGGVIGLAVSFVPMWLILGRNYGEFRLVLLATHPARPDDRWQGRPTPP